MVVGGEQGSGGGGSTLLPTSKLVSLRESEYSVPMPSDGGDGGAREAGEPENKTTTQSRTFRLRPREGGNPRRRAGPLSPRSPLY